MFVHPSQDSNLTIDAAAACCQSDMAYTLKETICKGYGVNERGEGPILPQRKFQRRIQKLKAGDQEVGGKAQGFSSNSEKEMHVITRTRNDVLRRQ